MVDLLAKVGQSSSCLGSLFKLIKGCLNEFQDIWKEPVQPANVQGWGPRRPWDGLGGVRSAVVADPYREPEHEMNLPAMHQFTALSTIIETLELSDQSDTRVASSSVADSGTDTKIITGRDSDWMQTIRSSS